MTNTVLNEPIDAIENKIYTLSPSLLKILIKDKTTGNNLHWATNTYEKFGEWFLPEREMKIEQLVNANILTPRVSKSIQEQQARTKDKGEVFTPAWMCNKMNNFIDEDWFERSNVFNKELENNWKTNKRKITFSKKLKKTWDEYISNTRLEITCGEAPYLVSRYDVVKGRIIPVEERIGILDRKLRILNENIADENKWLEQAKIAYESTYGYDYQGDNVVIARENLLYTLIDNMIFKFGHQPDLDILKQFAEIVTWNIWQMDGIDYTIPYSEIDVKPTEIKLGLYEEDENETKKEKQLARIKNWKTNRTLIFKELTGDNKMKFDYIIGNPPYQETISKSELQTQSNSNWIYQFYQFEADKISNCSCLIYPFGGWFDSPSRLNNLGNTLLNDKHTKLIYAYEGTSDKRAWYRIHKNPDPIFGNNVNLSAGVAIVMRKHKEQFGSFSFMNRIYSDFVANIEYDKVDSIVPNPAFQQINNKFGKQRLITIIKKSPFGIESDFAVKNPQKVSNTKDDWKKPIQLLVNDKAGSSGRSKIFWTDESVVLTGKEYVDVFKVITTSAYPKQKFSSGKPTVANVQQRAKQLIDIVPKRFAFGSNKLLLYASSNRNECENFIKYSLTKFFAGLMLQEPNRRSIFGSIIPLQDFTSESDIDWSKSIPEIDKQLYKKYDLSNEEIDFIERNVKEME